LKREQAREMKSNTEVTINAGTCATLASEITSNKINVDDICVEDDEDKSFEEAL